MEEKLKKKISKNIFTATLFFLIIISSITVFLISRNYVNSFADSADQSVKLATSYSQIKLDNIRNDSFRLAQTETITNGLESDKYAITINPKLNFLRSQYQDEISGIVLYSNQDYVYKTDSISVSSIIPISEILENEQLEEFKNNGETTFFFIQHQDALITHFSFIHKIYQNDQFLGYLMVNIRPLYLLASYFTYQNSDSILIKDQYLLVNNQRLYFSDPSTDTISENSGFSGLNNYTIQENLYNDSLTFITRVSTNNLLQHIFELIFVVLIINIIGLLIAYFAGNLIAKRIALRFNDLKQKMIQAPSQIK
jgi:hypothetical protein